MSLFPSSFPWLFSCPAVPLPWPHPTFSWGVAGHFLKCFNWSWNFPYNWLGKRLEFERKCLSLKEKSLAWLHLAVGLKLSLPISQSPQDVVRTYQGYDFLEETKNLQVKAKACWLFGCFPGQCHRSPQGTVPFKVCFPRPLAGGWLNENPAHEDQFLPLQWSLFRSAGHQYIIIQTMQNFSWYSVKFAPEEQKHLVRARKWLLTGFGNRGVCS